MPDGISQTRTAFVAALKRGDAKALSAVYSEHARLLPPSAELMEGRRAIEAFWRAGIEVGISEAEREPLQLERRDGCAFEIGRYELRLHPSEGGTVVDRGLYLLVHERQPDGCWRWAVELLNPDDSEDLSRKGRLE